MGISMSQSQEIHRLQALDERYHAKQKARLGRSAPQQFRGRQNQNPPPYSDRLKIKHLATEPQHEESQPYPPVKQHRTLEYDLQGSMDQFDLKGRENGNGPQATRRVKGNINIHDGLRVTKSKAEGQSMENPLSMRVRRVRVGKK